MKNRLLYIAALALLVAGCKSEPGPYADQPMAYLMDEAQKEALSSMVDMADSLTLVDFGKMDYMLDKVVGLNQENPDFNVFANTLSHGVVLDLPGNQVIATSLAGGAAFAGRLAGGAPVLGHNVDAAVRKQNGARLPVTHFAVHTGPKKTGGKPYESLGFSGSDVIGAPFDFAKMHDKNTDISVLALLPYFLTDGINEKGLAVSALTVSGNPSYASDGAEGNISLSGMLVVRYLLDNCADVGEAVELASRINPETPVAGYDLHYLLVDAAGDCAVLEWVKETGGRNTLQVVRDLTCVANAYCSEQARNLGSKGLLENPMLLPYRTCRLLAGGSEKYLKRYFNIDITDEDAVFDKSLDDCTFRLGRLKAAYEHPQGGKSGVFADEDDAVLALSNGFFTRTDGPLASTPKGPREMTVRSCIFNTRAKSVRLCINENESRTFDLSLKQFK